MQDGKKKAYGAGLLSSFGELEYALSDQVNKRCLSIINEFSLQPALGPFDPSVTSETKYPITSYQPKYFVADSFADAKNKLT